MTNNEIAVEAKLLLTQTRVTQFYDNGQLMVDSNIDFNGYHIGCFKSFWPDGTPWEESFYKNGLLHGELKLWLRDGSLEIHCVFDKGKRVKDYLISHIDTYSIKQHFYPSGEVCSESELINGEELGFVRKYDELGNLQDEAFLKDNFIHGVHKLYNSKREPFYIPFDTGYFLDE